MCGYNMEYPAFHLKLILNTTYIVVCVDSNRLIGLTFVSDETDKNENNECVGVGAVSLNSAL
jgi:hypothetical protein